MGQLFILPAGLSTKPLSASSKPTTQSRTRPEYPPLPQIPASIFSYRHHQHIAGEPCGSCEHAGRFPSQGEEVLHRTVCDLASPLNCARGNQKSPPKHLDWVILLLEVAPCLRQMAKPVSSLQVQKHQARTLQTLSRHLTTLSGLCAPTDWVCQ